MEKIGLFGGTFDPPHRAHLEVARLAFQQFHLDKLFLIPAYISPHKTSEVPQAQAQDRLAMTRLLVQDEVGMDVSDFEVSKVGPSYTSDTVKMFQSRFPGSDLFFVMGADAYHSLDDWHESDFLKAHLTFLVAPRPHYDCLLKSEDKAFMIDMPERDISATQVRSQTGQNVYEEDLTDRVKEYICNNRLYGIDNS